MSLFDFVKSAGRLLGIGHADAATQDETKPAPPTPDAPTIQAELTRLALPSTVTASVDGDTVTLAGSAPDAASREKLVLAAGNVAGVAHVTDNITLPGDAPAPVFHTVVHGDTLSAIAQKTLGNANAYPKIFEANKPMLTDPNKIYPGQVLRIPQA